MEADNKVLLKQLTAAHYMFHTAASLIARINPNNV